MADEMVIDVPAAEAAEEEEEAEGEVERDGGSGDEKSGAAPKAKRAAPPPPSKKKKATTAAAASTAAKAKAAVLPADDKTLQLPQARVKRIVRLDKDVGNVASDALLAITRSTELFIQALAELTYHEARTEKRKTVQYEDFAKVVKRYDNLEFLREIVPERITVRKAKERKLALESGGPLDGTTGDGPTPAAGAASS